MYLSGSWLFSYQSFECIAASGCSDVAMRYLSSPSPADEPKIHSAQHIA